MALMMKPPVHHGGSGSPPVELYCSTYSDDRDGHQSMLTTYLSIQQAESSLSHSFAGIKSPDGFHCRANRERALQRKSKDFWQQAGREKRKKEDREEPPKIDGTSFNCHSTLATNKNPVHSHKHAQTNLWVFAPCNTCVYIYWPIQRRLRNTSPPPLAFLGAHIVFWQPQPLCSVGSEMLSDADSCLFDDSISSTKRRQCLHKPTDENGCLSACCILHELRQPLMS